MSEPVILRATYRLTPEEHRILWIRAAYKHITAPHCINIVAKILAFDMVNKYEIPAKRLEELNAKYDELFNAKPADNAGHGVEGANA